MLSSFLGGKYSKILQSTSKYIYKYKYKVFLVWSKGSKSSDMNVELMMRWFPLEELRWWLSWWWCWWWWLRIFLPLWFFDMIINIDDDDALMMITYSVWRAGAKDETGSRWGGGGGGRVFKCLAFHLHTNIEQHIKHWTLHCEILECSNVYHFISTKTLNIGFRLAWVFKCLAFLLQFSLEIEHFVLLIC